MHLMESSDPKYSPMQEVKRRFFAMRNGITADVLRRAGSPYRIIFGLNLPQIVDIAAATPHSAELAQALWDNKTTRESQLLAPMIMPHDTFDIVSARRWAATVADCEAADILCHRLLRHMPYAAELADELAQAGGLALYTGVRLAVNIMYSCRERSLAIARSILAGKSDAAPLRLARQIIDELEAPETF